MNFFIGVIIGVGIAVTIWALLNYEIVNLEDEQLKPPKRKPRTKK